MGHVTYSLNECSPEGLRHIAVSTKFTPTDKLRSPTFSILTDLLPSPPPLLVFNTLQSTTTHTNTSTQSPQDEQNPSCPPTPHKIPTLQKPDRMIQSSRRSIRESTCPSPFPLFHQFPFLIIFPPSLSNHNVKTNLSLQGPRTQRTPKSAGPPTQTVSRQSCARPTDT